MITMHASHKQDPASVLQIIETLLIENYSVNLQLKLQKSSSGNCKRNEIAEFSCRNNYTQTISFYIAKGEVPCK